LSGNLQAIELKPDKELGDLSNVPKLDVGNRLDLEQQVQEGDANALRAVMKQSAELREFLWWELALVK